MQPTGVPRRIALVAGARPQFIKISPLHLAFARSATPVELQIIHTGQHFDDAMSEVFFRELNLPAPAHHLAISGGHHGAMTGRMMEGLEKVFLTERPDAVVVVGDTNSTLAGALVASKMGIPLAHVEAGLRSFRRAMPEEINRVVTDHVADMLFAPTETALKHLRNEGLAEKSVLVGDVMFDAVRIHDIEARKRQFSRSWVAADKPYLVASIHRAENTDSELRLRAMCDALQLVAENFDVILPLHPRTAARLAQFGISFGSATRLHVIPPVGYLDMLSLLCGSKVVVTDSGGLQKEAFFCGVPVVTLRDETEWVELTHSGWSRLVSPTDTSLMVSTIREMLDFQPGSPPQPYGDGHSADRIVEHVVRQIS